MDIREEAEVEKQEGAWTRGRSREEGGDRDVGDGMGQTLEASSPTGAETVCLGRRCVLSACTGLD